MVDKLEAPVKVKRILRRGQDDPLEQVRRPWYSVKRRECPEKILVLARKNYKVFADIGPTVGLMSRVLSVLDNGAGPNLNRKSGLPAGLETLVSFGPTQDIGDANNGPLRTVGTIRMPVRIGRFVATAEFIVCEKLAVPIILGADYFDRFLEEIYPQKKTVELADFSEVPIIRRFSARKERENLVRGEDETEGAGERISPRVKVARAMTIEPGTQRVVECTSKRAGLVVVQPHSPLYERHGLKCTNRVVQVEPDRPFRLLIANFRGYPVRVQKGQVVAELLPHPRAVLESKTTIGQTTIGEILRIEERGKENFPNSTQSPRDETRCQPSEEEREEQPGERSAGLSASVPTKRQRRIEPPPPDVEEFDLSHMPERLCQRFRRMLKKYSRMWDGTLGEINTTVHRIELIPETLPIAQARYRAGPKAREIEDPEVKKMLEARVIEPVQSEWASPVLLVPKPDGSMRFCVDYRKVNAVTVKDTYPLPRMDECLDSFRDTKVFFASDAISRYWQMPIPESDRDKTAFSCHSGLYRSSRMPFGLTNAPATFQSAMDILLFPFRWKSCLVYLDDIIIFSKSWEEHIAHVDEKLSVLEKAQASQVRIFRRKDQVQDQVPRPYRTARYV